MEARKTIVLCMLANEARQIDDPRYQFETEEKDHVVVKCVINNAEVLDVPGIEYRLHPNKTTENRLDALEVLIKDNTKRFSDVFRQLPYGIIKKNVTGIGATTLALTAENNCIVVCPTRSLAYEKYRKGIAPDGTEKYLYVGSAIGNIQKVSAEKIRAYLSNTEIPHKKILVVADSLPRLMEYLPLNLEKWHIMIDEIDSYQTDGVYRPALEDVIDYFFRFPERNRCLVSATIRPFSDPRLADLPLIDVKYEQFIRRPIHMIRTLNIAGSVAKTLKQITRQYPEDKIVVAYNSVSSMRVIIELLPDELKGQCEIWCSSQSEQQAGEYYPQKEIGTHLNKQITFLSCTFFTGIDIEDRYHLISVSDTRYLYTLLSPEKLLQIAGRCRHKDGLLSERFVYDIRARQTGEKKFDKQHNIACAGWIIKLFDLMNLGIANYNDVLHANAVRSVVNQVSGWKVSYGGSVPISLVRYNIEEKLTISYLNLDALEEFIRLRSQLYFDARAIITALEQDCEILEITNDEEPYSNKQQAIEIAVSDELKAIQNANIDECARLLKDRIADGSMSKNLMAQAERIASRELKVFISRFYQLMDYTPHEYLVDILSEARDKDNKWFRGFYNAVLFNALDQEHPFRTLIQSYFKPGERYSTEKIYEHMVAIFNASGLKIIKKPATAVSYLQSFCTLKRGKNCGTGKNYYRVEDYQSQKYLGKNHVEIPHIIDKFKLAGSVMKLK